MTVAIEGSPLGFLRESRELILFEAISEMCDSRFSGNKTTAGLLPLAEARAAESSAAAQWAELSAQGTG